MRMSTPGCAVRAVPTARSWPPRRPDVDGSNGILEDAPPPSGCVEGGIERPASGKHDVVHAMLVEDVLPVRLELVDVRIFRQQRVAHQLGFAVDEDTAGGGG